MTQKQIRKPQMTLKERYAQFWATVPPELDPRLHAWGGKHVPTNDNWYGTYEDGTVVGSVHVLSSGEIRISFWGNDDAGLELDLPLSVDTYQRWNAWLSGLSYIDMNTLIGLGFVWA